MTRKGSVFLAANRHLAAGPCPDPGLESCSLLLFRKPRATKFEAPRDGPLLSQDGVLKMSTNVVKIGEWTFLSPVRLPITVAVAVSPATTTCRDPTPAPEQHGAAFASLLLPVCRSLHASGSCICHSSCPSMDSLIPSRAQGVGWATPFIRYCGNFTSPSSFMLGTPLRPPPKQPGGPGAFCVHGTRGGSQI